MKHAMLFLSLIVFMSMTVSKGMATHVTVYSEGGYSGKTVVVKVFADIDDDGDGPLISAGVKLKYPAAKLNNPEAVKNEATWYLGYPENTYSYVAPFSGSIGEVVVLLARLDSRYPLFGVSKERILLACVRFDRIENTQIPVPSDFNIECGKSSPYTNFVTVTGVELDNDIVFNSSFKIATLSGMYLMDSIRSLKTMSMSSQTIPDRASEIGVNNRQVDLTDAIHHLKSAAEIK